MSTYSLQRPDDDLKKQTIPMELRVFTVHPVEHDSESITVASLHSAEQSPESCYFLLICRQLNDNYYRVKAIRCSVKPISSRVI